MMNNGQKEEVSEFDTAIFDVLAVRWSSSVVASWPNLRSIVPKSYWNKTYET